MSLRIRRGTDEQRQGVVFDSGELVVTTDEFKLFVGDGATAGGRNIATSLAGNGLIYNPSTEALDLSLNITTDDVQQGVNNKYFSTELAIDTIGSALVAGNPTNTGISFIYGSPQDNTDRINAVINLNLDSLSDVVISGTPTNGQVLKYNSTLNAWVPGTDSGGGVSGLTALEDDANPKLGGDLSLNGYNINGTGNIYTAGSIYATEGLGGTLLLNNYDITGTGDIDITGTIGASVGLGADLPLNNFNINGVGNIDIEGTFNASFGLGNDLILNSYNITGTGDIDIIGSIKAGLGLGGDLSLNGYNINGTGDIDTIGTIYASAGLGGDLVLNGHNINGTGNIGITGGMNLTGNFNIGGQIVLSAGKLRISGNVITSNDDIPPDNTSNGAANDYLIRLGGTASPTTLWLSSDRNFAVNTGLVSDTNDGTGTYFRTSRGTLASPTKLTPGDRIAKNVAQGWDGDKYWHAGGYGIGTDPGEVISTSVVPGRFEAQVRDHTGNVRSLFYTARGVLTGAVLQPTSFATTAARDAALSGNNGAGNPILQAGMMCFVADSDGNGTPAFMGYNGSAWVTLG